jgi:hypothetical protein
VKLPGPTRPTLPTWAVQQVGSYLRYTGHHANVVATAAYDPGCVKTLCLGDSRDKIPRDFTGIG